MESRRSKYILIGMSIFCILLIIITSFRDSFLDPLRTGVGYFLIPVQSGVNRAGTLIYNEITDYSHFKGAVEENKQLRKRIDGLVEENTRLQAEQFELNRLRELYQLDQDYQQYEKIGARVIAKDSGTWFQVFRINKGSADGVRVDANVLSGGGLVGIVTDVGANYATVRSIIDDVSRVSVMAQQSGDTCFAEGDLTLFSEGRLRLSKITKDGDIKDGDRIVTSNVSSKYLPGILVGYATDIVTDETRLTKSGYLIPAAQFNNLQEVLVILELKEEQTDGDLTIGQGNRNEKDCFEYLADAFGIYHSEWDLSPASVSGSNSEPSADSHLFLWLHLRERSRSFIRSSGGDPFGFVLQRSVWILYSFIYPYWLSERDLHPVLL